MMLHDSEFFNNNVKTILYSSPAGTYTGDFHSDMEDCFPILKKYTEPVRTKVHQIAWEAGHAAGYHDVYNQYFDLAELLIVVKENAGPQ
jgi:hypothetical protein